MQEEKCPNCLGTSLCDSFREKKCFISSVASGVKNVHSGFVGKHQVVFKKLAHDKEWSKFDTEEKSYSLRKNLNVKEVKGRLDVNR